MTEAFFDGHVALVTGAASGIGRASALLFAAHGARVACSDIHENALAETVQRIHAAGGEALAIAANLCDPDAAPAIVAQTVARFGRLDHAFNNAGVAGSSPASLEASGFRRTLAINLDAVAAGMEQQIAQMVRNGGGTIVNTASIAGLSGAVGAIDYTAAKHGVVGLTKAAARHYGPKGIRINAVCPGIIDTAMLDVIPEANGVRAASFARLSPITHAPGTPDDIAEAVIWLSSARSRFVHGVALPVDGGFML